MVARLASTLPIQRATKEAFVHLATTPVGASCATQPPLVFAKQFAFTLTERTLKHWITSFCCGCDASVHRNTGLTQPTAPAERSLSTSSRAVTREQLPSEPHLLGEHRMSHRDPRARCIFPCVYRQFGCLQQQNATHLQSSSCVAGNGFKKRVNNTRSFAGRSYINA
jgi:hypothetical protein